MFNYKFDMEKAKYLVILKESYYKYKNNIYTFENAVYMDREYGIYTYTLEDTKIFLFQEMFNYYKKHNIENYGENKYHKMQKLMNFINNYKVYIINFKSKTESLEELITINMNEIILNIIQWNGQNKYKIKYLNPVLKFNNEKKHFVNKNRSCFHKVGYSNLPISKREKVAGNIPEYQYYLKTKTKK